MHFWLVYYTFSLYNRRIVHSQISFSFLKGWYAFIKTLGTFLKIGLKVALRNLKFNLIHCNLSTNSIQFTVGKISRNLFFYGLELIQSIVDSNPCYNSDALLLFFRLLIHGPLQTCLTKKFCLRNFIKKQKL